MTYMDFLLSLGLPGRNSKYISQSTRCAHISSPGRTSFCGPLEEFLAALESLVGLFHTIPEDGLPLMKAASMISGHVVSLGTLFVWRNRYAWYGAHSEIMSNLRVSEVKCGVWSSMQVSEQYKSGDAVIVKWEKVWIAVKVSDRQNNNEGLPGIYNSEELKVNQVTSVDVVLCYCVTVLCYFVA